MIKASRSFLGNDFLLENDFAYTLYHEYAATTPIVDYHNHLSPHDIAENRRFSNITEAWLEGDHYKWRAMRANGVAERYCTGDAAPEEKFSKWAETVPFTMRNPLYHWTHLELKRYFGIDALLNGSNAKHIYRECSQMLQQEEFRVLGLLKKMNVEVVCTTDDPADSLEYHQRFAAQEHGLKMFPTFRPDKVYALDDLNGYPAYLDKLASTSGVSISSYDDLLTALQKRIGFFQSLGCRASDHGLEHLYFAEATDQSVRETFRRAMSGATITTEEIFAFRASVLFQLCRMYHANGWIQQFHLGALRNNNSKMTRQLGADAGFDSIGDFAHARYLSRFLDRLDATNQLAKTILYNLNPADNALFATMAGNFNDGSVPGKMQYGSGWWFLDQKDGMECQINTLSNMGLLSRFVGMVTDSRSFLSFPRHEYFRRVLCNLLGRDIQKGELPDDIKAVGTMVQSICYLNARSYFGF
jgi:glucuronate isomerase